MEFSGRTALVTGAAQGIGAAVAEALARDGAAVALVDRQDGKLKSVAASLHAAGAVAHGIFADVSDTQAVEAAVELAERMLGPIDILVNVAGILRMGSALEMSETDWDAIFSVNAGGVFRMSRAVAARMVPRARGTIVTVGSNAAAVPRIGMAAYAASKAASAHFTKCLALELAPYGIRCNVVSPGSTDTEMQHLLWDDATGADAVLRGSLEHHRLGIPLGRIAMPADIAEAVCFLASDRARHITMHDLRVDGGATLAA